MTNRVVVVLLIPTLLLQGIAFAHSHPRTGFDEAHERTHTAHIHIPGVGAHHHHHEADHPPDHHDGDEASNATSEPDHDADAVYIACVDAVAERPQADDDVVSLARSIAIGLMPVVALTELSRAQSTIAGHPPPRIDCVCPLYIQHLALLI